MHCIPGFASLAPLLAFAAGRADAHPGKLDANGCQYEAASGDYHCHEEAQPDRNTSAAVKKSRENVRHDQSPPNYSTTEFFIASKTLAECQSSGGRAPG
jgi:hypothetical protein